MCARVEKLELETTARVFHLDAATSFDRTLVFTCAPTHSFAFSILYTKGDKKIAVVCVLPHFKWCKNNNNRKIQCTRCQSPFAVVVVATQMNLRSFFAFFCRSTCIIFHVREIYEIVSSVFFIPFENVVYRCSRFSRQLTFMNCKEIRVGSPAQVWVQFLLVVTVRLVSPNPFCFLHFHKKRTHSKVWKYALDHIKLTFVIVISVSVTYYIASSVLPFVDFDLRSSQLCASAFFPQCLLSLPIELFRNVFCFRIFLEIVQCLIEVSSINVPSNWVRYHCCKRPCQTSLIVRQHHQFFASSAFTTLKRCIFFVTWQFVFCVEHSSCGCSRRDAMHQNCCEYYCAGNKFRFETSFIIINEFN